MTVSLLDVNVLIALLDPTHTFHPSAARWFRQHSSQGWATCPLTENSFVRIVTHGSYPSPRTVADAIDVLEAARAQADHSFWPDDLSLADTAVIDPGHILSSGQVTDSYLLGLAVRAGGHFVTFDRRIDLAAVRTASASALVVLNPKLPESAISV